MSKTKVFCKVSPGLFANEYHVMVNHSAAYYVSRDAVEVKSEPQAGGFVDGKITGYIVEKKGSRVLVQFPGEVIVGGTRTWVEQAELVS